MSVENLVTLKQIKEHANKVMTAIPRDDKTDYRFMVTYKMELCKFEKGEKEYKTVKKETLIFSAELASEDDLKKIEEAVKKLTEEK